MSRPRHLNLQRVQNLQYNILRVLFCPFVVRKATAHVDKKALSMYHQAQKGFRGIFVGIPQHQKWYIVYVPSTRKIISSYDDIFDESLSSTIAYTSQPYAESMNVHMDVSYIPCATSSRKHTGDIIRFTQFQEGNLLSETWDDAESSDKSDNGSIMPPLTSE